MARQLVQARSIVEAVQAILCRACYFGSVGGFKVSLGTVQWYGTDFDSSE